VARRLFYEAKYPEYQYRLMESSMQSVVGQMPLVLQEDIGEIRGVPIKAKDEFAVFIRIDPPARAKIGSVWEFDVFQKDSKLGRILGGSRYRVVINKPANK
jgi:hypothetical protein